LNGIPHVKSIHNTRYQFLLTLLLEARNAAGMTQKELATKLGRPQSFVSKTENGERRLDVIEFMDVCRVLGADWGGMLRRVEVRLPSDFC
jgi:transcriptional regulator with XRE-family HTH domain